MKGLAKKIPTLYRKKTQMYRILRPLLCGGPVLMAPMVQIDEKALIQQKAVRWLHRCTCTVMPGLSFG